MVSCNGPARPDAPASDDELVLFDKLDAGGAQATAGQVPAGQAPRADQAPPAGQHHRSRRPPDPAASRASQAAPTGPAPAADHLQPGPGAVLGTATISDFDLIALMNDLGVDCSSTEDSDPSGVLIEDEDLGAPDDSGYSLARIAEHLPAGSGLASLLGSSAPAAATDWELPGIAGSYRRLAAWAQAGELAAVAEIAGRSAAANPKIGLSDDGRPRCLPPEAAAQVALAMQMSQPGASEWVDLAIHLRWRLPATSAALSAGVIDLGRARIIADGTAVLPDDLASAVEDRVLPKAGEQTTGQLRGAVRRAVIAADPDGAEERRKDTERRAKVSLFPDEHGTATLAGSSLPGVHAAAAMARITAMARALKSSGAKGGLDLLRAHTFLGLLLGTMPLIPPSADGPPGWPQPPDEGPAEPLAEDGAGDPAPDRDDSGSRSAGDGAADDDICPSTDDGAAADHDDSGSRPASGSAAADHDDSRLAFSIRQRSRGSRRQRLAFSIRQRSRGSRRQRLAFSIRQRSRGSRRQRITFGWRRRRSGRRGRQLPVDRWQSRQSACRPQRREHPLCRQRPWIYQSQRISLPGRRERTADALAGHPATGRHGRAA